jgi:hypothetical protein
MASRKGFQRGTGSSLRPNKRFITGHNAQGNSIYLDAPEQSYRMFPDSAMARSYALAQIPAVLKNDKDVVEYTGKSSVAGFSKSSIVVPGGGANVVLMDFEPGYESPMHRTVSIDFSICVIGVLECELDSGQKVRLEAGVSEHVASRLGATLSIY